MILPLPPNRRAEFLNVPATQPDFPRVPHWVQGSVYAAILMLAVTAEGLRWTDPVTRTEALTGWLCGREADWLPFLPVLVIAPLALWPPVPQSRSVSRSPGWLSQQAGTSPAGWREWVSAGMLFLLALLVSLYVGRQFDSLPPAYHDEYSYLFQAKTFLAGRLWYPSFSSQPEIFDQIHVLNEGRFASRYFPGTGLWLAPFAALGDPWLGQQLAQGICASLIFWIGRELSCNGVGLLAGSLFAVSPGLVLFSNLLLAHHPALLGLLLFLWAFLTWMRSGGAALLLVAGFGLAWAMLCRPMTAAGFGLPFGIAFLAWWITGRCWWSDSRNRAESPLSRRLVHAAVLSVPLLCGIGFQLYIDREITGSAWTTPYQLYTEIYTPRHMYGFNNVVRGERQLGPKVLDNYDRWAENLTPVLAGQNVLSRLENSLRWTLGIVPLLLGGLAVLLTPQLGSRRWWLIVLAIVSLHAVHVPYWFTGIMGWHYVLETAPLWLLLFAEGTWRLCGTWFVDRRLELLWWWGALIAVALSVNLITVRPLWPGRLEAGIAEVHYPRALYGTFRKKIEELRQGQPAVVLVAPDPADRHMDYVTNPPDLSGPVLVARLRNPEDLTRVASLFPDRTVFVFDAATRKFQRSAVGEQ